jgi:acetyltransferase-like isoleucine patch superfamily enzyme
MFKHIIIILKLLKRYKTSFFSCNKTNRLRMKFPESHISSKISLEHSKYGEIIIGPHTIIKDFTVIAVVDDPSRNEHNSKLIIGSDTYIGELNNIRASGGEISIGDNCSVSQHVTIIASNHQYRRDELIRKQAWSTENNFVRIGNDVWIGANVVILPGVTIGNGAVIGAGSVVTRDIPEFAVAIGSPARVVKYRI